MVCGTVSEHRICHNDLPDEVFTKVNIEFYGEPKDAVFKALVE